MIFDLNPRAEIDAVTAKFGDLQKGLISSSPVRIRSRPKPE